MDTSEKKQRVYPGRCQKCDDMGHATKLIGGYNGSFCNSHLNEWHEIVTDKPDYEDYVVKRVSQDTHIRGGIANQFSRDLSRAILKYQNALYNFAKTWAEELGEVTETQDGLYRKYIVSKASGEPIDPKAFYFPLRLDKDPHARSAARAYADSVRYRNSTLADELYDLLDGIETDLAKRSEHD